MTMTTDPSTSTSRYLITDTVTAINGSSDSIPQFTMVGGQPVSAALEIQSTSGALLIPRMTTAERDALIAFNGMIIYNITVNNFEIYENGAWVAVPSVPGSTTANDIAVFTDNAGTLGDSGVRLLQNFAQQNLFLGENTGNTTSLANSNTTIAFGLSTIPGILNSSSASVCVGSGVGLHATNVESCTFFGNDVASAVGSGNLLELTAFGASALQDVIQSAVGLTAIGFASQLSATTAINCTSLGWGTLQNITVAASAADSTAAGYSSLFLATTALRTTAYGSNSASGHLSYTDCTIIGEGADNTVNALTGTTLLGQGTSAAASNSTAIGIGATVTTANSMSLGALGTFVGINTTSPIANFHINGSIAYKQPVVVAPGSFPYIASVNDYMIIGFPSGAGNIVQLPDATAANVGKSYRISNSSAGADTITVTTTSGQPVQNSILNIIVGADFISAPDGVGGYRYYSCY